jgi:hypothetical protein
MNLEKVIDQYHQAVDEFSRGNPQPVKVLFSHRDDVTLANPFGPAVRGWKRASDALEFASSRFRDGEVSDFERIAEYESTDLATILETERWSARVGDREDIAPFQLRVTTTFRREDETWEIVHRHADPTPTPHPDGPLRGA